jgi:UDP-N-acetylglucosamine--N-acetylmuramyl-(pentapeptide) pyrophosphoryl-undecaprenol N-acetylglucosamine transferase
LQISSSLIAFSTSPVSVPLNSHSSKYLNQILLSTVSYNQKVLFFTSPIGLGHATRDIAIAEKLKQIVSDEILFISGGAAYDLISRAGFQVLNLYRPPHFTVDAGKLRNRFVWLMKYIIYYKRSKKIAEDIIMKTSHKHPLIVSDEDFASIAVSQNIILSKSILIYDILKSSTCCNRSYDSINFENKIGETHFTTGPLHIFEKKMNSSLRDLINKCDKVIIPDFGSNKANLVYVGPIVREVTSDRKRLRNKLGLTRKTILVCAGGTDAGRHLIQKSLEAYEKLKKRFDIDLILVSGPNLRLNISNDFHNLGFVDNLHEYIYASDLVISLAGRSTIDESIVYGTPGIFIPIKNHFEQEQNAIRLGYKYEDISNLERLIEEKLGFTRINTISNSRGAEVAAKIISEFL